MRQIKVAADDLPLLKAIFYGPPGSFKTPLMASFNLDERTAPLLIVDIGGRPETCAAYDPSLHVVQLTDLREINDLYSYFSQDQRADHPFRKVFDPPLAEDFKFKTLGIDTYTTYQACEILYLMGSEHSTDLSALKDLTKVPAPSQIQDWQVIAPNSIVPAQVFFSLPINVIFNLQESTKMQITKGGPSTTKRRPHLLGQAADLVPAFANFVACLTWATPNKAWYKAHGYGDDVRPKSEPLLSWRTDSTQSYTKQDYIRPGSEFTAYDDLLTEMFRPTATKLLDYAMEVRRNYLKNLTTK